MNRRGLKRSQLVATGVALLISVIFIVTLVAPGPTVSNVIPTPDTRDNNASSNTFEPTDAAENIANSEPYVHPSGIFQSYRPAIGQWQLLSNTSNAVEGERGQVVDARFRGNRSCAVIHVLAEVNGGYESIEDLDSVLDDTYFAEAWGQYGSWEEASRNVLEDRIEVEFTLRQPADLSVQCPDTYHARTISWVSNGTAQHVRFVVRNDDRDSLQRLEALVVPSFITYPHNINALGNNWRVQDETEDAHFFLLPSTGFTQDTSRSTDERLVYTGTISASNTTVAVEMIPDTTFADQDEAEAWLGAFVPDDAEILSRDTTAQSYASGYLFSYEFRDAEGVATAAAASLLNDADGNLHFLEIQIAGAQTDLLETSEDVDFVTDLGSGVVRSFTVMIPSY
jgi:hypothetical protein